LTPDAARQLQHDLRALGYLHHGIDGSWGNGVDAAIRAIRIDLCNPAFAPLIAAANSAGKVVAAPGTGTAALEPELAICIGLLVDTADITKLSSSLDAAGDNRRLLDNFRATRSLTAPVPFLAAMFRQESDGRHYHVPTTSDADNFVIVGLDRNDGARADRITSRGYGLGQFTLFHHPPSLVERKAFIDDPVGNVQAAFTEFREKFDGSVRSSSAAVRADDNYAEHPLRKLTLCKYPNNDSRYLADCRNCALAAGTVDLHAGDPVFPGSATTWQSTQYYPDRGYSGVPVRAAFPCDWPYAARRYNGSGINSFHYQARILRNLLS
jgi:hypothetical protein